MTLLRKSTLPCRSTARKAQERKYRLRSQEWELREEASMIRLMLVDDHAVLRDGLRNIISVVEDIEVVGEAVSGDEALDQVEKCQPDMILMDINMPVKNGVEVTGILKRKYPHIKILIL